jgi:hypothetical protein
MAHETLYRTLGRFAFTGAFVAGLILGGIGSVRAFDEADMPDTKVLRNVLEAIGLRAPGSEEGIEYRERSPLVVPPNRDLPPPETEAAAPNPAWPTDPDVKRRKEIAESRKSRKSRSVEEEARVLSPSELEVGRTARRSTGPSTDMEKAINPSKPSELGYNGGLFSKMFSFGNKEEAMTFQREPERSTLTDPPAGYRTPSPAQPYGLGKTGPTKPEPVDQAVGSLGK